MTKFAVTMPGKMGDLLYTIPTTRYLYKTTGIKSDIWTSEYCAPLKSLFEYQECVDTFNISPEYVLERTDMGCQPWYVPVPDNNYARVYHMGFREVPDTALHQYMAAKYADIHVPLAIEYDYPELLSYTWDTPYIILAPRGKSTFEHIFNDLADMTTTLIVGGKGDYTGHGIDLTGLDMLEVLTLLSGAKAFVGLMSSQLVLANGFDIPRVALNGFQADMRHSVIYHRNIYTPPNASASDIMNAIEQNLTS